MFYYVLLCFVMLISKHNIIVKQSKFVRELFSRLLKIIVVKTLTTLKFYNKHISSFLQVLYRYRLWRFFFINRTFLIEQIFNYRKHVKIKSKIIKIRDIENFTLNDTKYISIIFEIFDKFINDKLIMINFTRHVYIVDNLKIKMFMNNNIFDLKKIIIDLNK